MSSPSCSNFSMDHNRLMALVRVSMGTVVAASVCRRCFMAPFAVSTDGLDVEFGCYGSSRSCLKSLAVGGWVAYMENNATLSEDWMGFSDRSSVAKR